MLQHQGSWVQGTRTRLVCNPCMRLCGRAHTHSTSHSYSATLSPELVTEGAGRSREVKAITGTSLLHMGKSLLAAGLAGRP